MRTDKHHHSVDQEIHALFCRWTEWHHSRRKFVNLSEARNHLWALASKSIGGEPRDAECSAELNALNIAITALEIYEQNIVCGYYLLKRKPVKILAHEAKLQRSFFYDKLRDIRRRVYSSAKRLTVRATPDTIALDIPDRLGENTGELVEAR